VNKILSGPALHALACMLVVLMAACAKGSSIGIGGSGGEGGFGGSGGATDGPSTSDTTGSGKTTSATTGAGGNPGSTTTSASTGPNSTSATTGATTAAATTSAGTGGGCVGGQHMCGGVCVGNTPQTGCTSSMTCVPCSAPLYGTAVCSPAGDCDFTCQAGYTKQGMNCACAAQCCSDADCSNGQTCMGGTCQSPPPPPPMCDQAQCAAGCIAACLFQGKVGLGICLNGACNCLCQ
jgi:hypothetical protein